MGALVTGRLDLNALALRPGGSGVQTYMRELLAELPTVSRAAISVHVQADAVDELPGAVRPIVHRVASGARRAITGLALDTGDAAVHHGLDADLPLQTCAGTVATIHDLSVFDAPWAHSRYRAAGERLLVARAIRRADELVAVSDFTAERISARFGRTASVTPLAARSGLAPATEIERERARATYRLPDRCVLQVASIEPRKDVHRLAAVCRELEVPLLLAGTVVPGEVVPAGARHLGYVPAVDLPALYGAVTVVAYCSRYEGFGLPAVEALACGAALVTTAVGAIPQACGDAAAVVPAERTEPLVAALRGLLNDVDHRTELRRRGPGQAARSTWRHTAELTAAVHRRLGLP